MSRCPGRLLLLLCASLWQSNAQAMSCRLVGTPQLVFGQYDPQSGGTLDVQTTVAIECTPAFAGEAVDLILSLVAPPSAALAMQHEASGEPLAFGLYYDPARSRPVNWQNLFSMEATLTGPMTLTFPLYGRIPAAQNVTVGDYRLPLTVLLNY